MKRHGISTTVSGAARPGPAVIGIGAVILALAAFAEPARSGEMAKLSLSAGEAKAGETVTVEGSGFRVGTEASFIYTSTRTCRC